MINVKNLPIYKNLKVPESVLDKEYLDFIKQPFVATEVVNDVILTDKILNEKRDMPIELFPQQIKSLEYITKRSLVTEEKDKKELLEILKEEKEMDKLKEIYFNSPLIIKIPIKNFLQIISESTDEDSKYKNCYEFIGNTMDGRIRMENVLYGDFYKQLDCRHRPKSGIIDIDKNIGCNAKCYGAISLVLNPDTVKFRTTITPGDSISHNTFNNPIIGTFNSFLNVLNNIGMCGSPDKGFDTIFKEEYIKNIMKRKKTFYEDIPWHFQEIQIHGDIFFKRDITRILLPVGISENQIILMKNFCNGNKIELSQRTKIEL